MAALFLVQDKARPVLRGEHAGDVRRGRAARSRERGTAGAAACHFPAPPRLAQGSRDSPHRRPRACSRPARLARGGGKGPVSPALRDLPRQTLARSRRCVGGPGRVGESRASAPPRCNVTGPRCWKWLGGSVRPSMAGLIGHLSVVGGNTRSRLAATCPTQMAGPSREPVITRDETARSQRFRRRPDIVVSRGVQTAFHATPRAKAGTQVAWVPRFRGDDGV